MPYFPNIELDIYTYTDLPEADAYGNPKKSYVYRETILGDLQPSSRKDTLTEAGEILQDTYKLYIDSKIIINSNDIFKEKNGTTYSIIGSPILNSRFKITKHKKIELQKTNKPIKVEPIKVVETNETNN